MKIIRDIHNLPKAWNGASITIGSFDSFHEGHQQLVFECVKHARRNNIPSVLVTFESSEKLFFSGLEKYKSRINNLRKRSLILKELGLDYLLLLKFNAKLISMSATSFVKEIIIKKLMTRVMIIGDDFQFGKLRLGNAFLLCFAQNTYSLQVIRKTTFMYKNERVSSSRVRFYTKKNELSTVKAILGKL